jgi:hypothetical protein
MRKMNTSWEDDLCSSSCMFHLWKRYETFWLNLVMGKQVIYKGLPVSYAS